jgi:SAM-dependent methyltransferase
MKAELIEQLRTLYSAASKHSSYQILPPKLGRLLGESEIKPRSRHEAERFEFIKQHVSFAGKRVLDVGGNTGFFSFQALETGADEVCYFDGNESHAEFVRTAAKLMELTSRIQVEARYLDFSSANTGTCYDVGFLMNVLHHFGDDYGNAETLGPRVHQHILQSVIHLSRSVKCLVFQLGFNWKGNRELPLFRNGTKKEMIEFIVAGLSGSWKSRVIGAAERRNDAIQYFPLSEDNLLRIDSLGEFLNRPIFILDSLNYGTDHEVAARP